MSADWVMKAAWLPSSPLTFCKEIERRRSLEPEKHIFLGILSIFLVSLDMWDDGDITSGPEPKHALYRG